MARFVTTPLQLQSAATGVGPGNALEMDSGWTGALMEISGAFVGTITFESAIDTTNMIWTAVSAMSLTDGTRASSFTAPGLYLVAAPGARQIRARISAYTSGAITVKCRPTDVVDPTSQPGAVTATSAIAIKDGASSNLATVAQFHNADNQSLGGVSFGLNTGGVAQLLNAAGNLDRQRESGFDAAPSTGISAGAANFAVPFSSTIALAITANAAAQAVAPASMAGISVGSSVRMDAGLASQEDVFVSATTAATFTAIFTKNHLANSTTRTFQYNVARDAAVGDAVAPVGLSASATYLYNNVTGLMELDRSAQGEKDGANGQGTAVAAEYEFNAGGPTTNAGLASGLAFDRARSLQGKGTGSATQSAGGAAGTTSITASLAVATNTLQPGQQIRIDRNTVNEESAYVSVTYVPGTALIPLQSALAFNHAAATIEWDVFSSGGPGLNGFHVAGIGIEEEALYNPIDGKFYIERSATQDVMPAANVVAESGAVLNAAGTMDREREAYADNMVATGIPAESEMLFNAAANNGFERARSVMGKAMFTGALSAVPGAAGAVTLAFTADPSLAAVGALKAGMQVMLWNPGSPPTNPEVVTVLGTYVNGLAVPITPTQIAHPIGTVAQWEGFAAQGPALAGFLGTGMDIDEDSVYDPISGLYYLERSATADAMAAANIVAEAGVIWNGTTFDREREATADGLPVTGIAGESEMLWNGTGFDRARSASIGDAQPATGIGADQEYLFNGVTFDRARTAGVGSVAVPSTGIQAATDYLWNGATFDAMREPTSDGLAVAGIEASGLMAFNGVTFDRLRTMPAAFATLTPQSLAMGLNVMNTGGGLQPLASGNGATDGASGANAASNTPSALNPVNTYDRLRSSANLSAAMAENVPGSLKTASGLFALDTAALAGSQQVPLRVESTAQPNLRASVWNAGVEQAVKAAATAAVAADPAAVVALSPNTPLPAGTNVIGGTTSAAGSQVDGHSASIGTTTDLATANTLIGRLKALIALLPTSIGQKLSAGSLSVVVASDQTLNTFNPNIESALGLPLLNAAFIDSAAVATNGSKKVLYLVVTTALTWVTAGQATFRPYAGRTAMAAAGGAVTQIDANHTALGVAQNLGAAAATTLPVGTYRLSAGAVPELQWPDPFVGLELNFPSALTAGAATAFMESST